MPDPIRSSVSGSCGDSYRTNPFSQATNLPNGKKTQLIPRPAAFYRTNPFVPHLFALGTTLPPATPPQTNPFVASTPGLPRFFGSIAPGQDSWYTLAFFTHLKVEADH